MLTLPIKKKWFDMILSGEKKEEYREIKPYWITRFDKIFPLNPITLEPLFEIQDKVMFRNGYSKNSPSFVAKCTLSIGTGKEEWGAEKGKQYFILTVQEILNGSEWRLVC